MSWGWAIFTYVVMWWIMLFTTLPLWIEQPNERTPEHYIAAPKNPHLRRKIILNSIITALVVLGIHLLLKSGIIPVRGVIQ